MVAFSASTALRVSQAVESSPLILESLSLRSFFSWVSCSFFAFSSIKAFDFLAEKVWNCSKLLCNILIFEFNAYIFCFALSYLSFESSRTLKVFSNSCFKKEIDCASSCDSLIASLSLAVWLARSLDNSLILLYKIFSLSWDLFKALQSLSYSCLNRTRD